MFVQENAEGDTGERLSARRPIGRDFPIAKAEIFFVDEPSVLHDQQAAVFGGCGRALKSLIEQGPGARTWFARPPSAGGVGRGK